MCVVRASRAFVLISCFLPVGPKAKTCSDFMKHAVLLRCCSALSSSSTRWTYVDFFPADLTQETKSFPDHILNKILERPPNKRNDIIGSYASFINKYNESKAVTIYPGRSEFVRHCMARRDRGLVVSENAQHITPLQQSIPDSRFQIKHTENILQAAGALIPRTRKGVAYFDTSSFSEATSEATQIKVGDLAQQTANLWPQATTIIAYPLNGKTSRPMIMLDRFLKGGSNRVLMGEIYENGNPLNPQGCGIAISNPPYGIEAPLQRALNGLSELFIPDLPSRHNQVRSKVAWLTPFDVDSKEHAKDGPQLIFHSTEWARPTPDPEAVHKILGQPDVPEVESGDEVDVMDRLDNWEPEGATYKDYRGVSTSDYPPPGPLETTQDWQERITKIQEKEQKDLRKMYAWIKQQRKFPW
jgi:23S rRNA A2030 N6-methylase RlmJ